MKIGVAALLVLLLLAGCAVTSQRPSHAKYPGNLLDVSLCGDGSYVAQFNEDRVVRLFSVAGGIKYAKLSTADMATLIGLLNETSLPGALSAFNVPGAGRFCYGEHPFVVLRFWPSGDEYRLNQSEVDDRPPVVRSLIHFVDQLTKSHFGAEFTLLGGDSGAVKPKNWLKLSVRPVAGLAEARPATARPAA